MVEKRNARVFGATVAAIVVGGALLRLLGGNPPAAGAFSLSGYYQLESAEDAISSRAEQFIGRWHRIEVYCGDAFAVPDDPAGPCCHFVVFSRSASEDGEAAATENWQRQLSIAPNQTWTGTERTIRICVSVDGTIGRPTDSQIKKTEAVVEALSRRFDIPTSAIDYPANWWLGSLK